MHQAKTERPTLCERDSHAIELIEALGVHKVPRVAVGAAEAAELPEWIRS